MTSLYPTGLDTGLGELHIKSDDFDGVDDYSLSRLERLGMSIPVRLLWISVPRPT